MRLAEKLKALAEMRRLSQAEIAERVAFSQSQVSKWFRGVNTPDVYQARDLARVLGVSVDYLSDDRLESPPPALTREERDLLGIVREIGVVEATARLTNPRGKEGFKGRPAPHPEDD